MTMILYDLAKKLFCLYLVLGKTLLAIQKWIWHAKATVVSKGCQHCSSVQNSHQRFRLVAQNTQLMWPLGGTPLGCIYFLNCASSYSWFVCAIVLCDIYRITPYLAIFFRFKHGCKSNTFQHQHGHKPNTNIVLSKILHHPRFKHRQILAGPGGSTNQNGPSEAQAQKCALLISSV